MKKRSFVLRSCWFLLLLLICRWAGGATTGTTDGMFWLMQECEQYSTTTYGGKNNSYGSSGAYPNVLNLGCTSSPYTNSATFQFTLPTAMSQATLYLRYAAYAAKQIRIKVDGAPYQLLNLTATGGGVHPSAYTQGLILDGGAGIGTLASGNHTIEINIPYGYCNLAFDYFTIVDAVTTVTLDATVRMDWVTDAPKPVHYVLNGGFEQAGSWFFSTGGTIQASGAYSGTQCAKSVSNMGSSIKQEIPITGGEYQLSMFLKSDGTADATANTLVHFRLYDAAGVQITSAAPVGKEWYGLYNSTYDYYMCPPATSSWKPFTTIIQIPSAAAKMVLCLSWRGAGTGGSTYALFDDVTLTRLAPTPEVASRSKLYWWIGNQLGMLNMSQATLVDGFCLAYSGAWNAGYEAQKGFRLVGDYTNVSTTVAAMQDHYNQGARKLSIDMEGRGFSVADAQSLTSAIRAMPGLSVIQWIASREWNHDARVELEKCVQIVLVEMDYPMDYSQTLSLAECQNGIAYNMLPYLFKPIERHALGLCTVVSYPSITLITWDNLKRQIDAAKAYANSLGHTNQAIAFYYPVDAAYADQIAQYAKQP